MGFLFSIFLIFISITNLSGQSIDPDLLEVQLPGSISTRTQPARIWVPKDSNHKKPLLVVLHTWSGNYLQNNFGGTRSGISIVQAECQKRNWAMIMPEFQGPNNRPEACASEQAIQDVVDAVHYMKSKYSIDEHKVFLFGVSGGGHMALMMAARHPELWCGVSSWVPISDLNDWHHHCHLKGLKYAKDLEKICGGTPKNQAAQASYHSRSPIHFLKNPDIAQVSLHIHAGIRDGHTGSVPISHSLRAFNQLALANSQSQFQISSNDIEFMTRTASVPEDLFYHGSQFPHWNKKLLFFRQAGNASIFIFDGGHEGDAQVAFEHFSVLDKKE